MVNKEKNGKKISREAKERKVAASKSKVPEKKVRSKQADDKSARIKKAKQMAIRKLFTWTILVGILVGVLAFLFKSELFKICKIEVTGNSQISQETLLELANIDLDDNIFLANTIKAKNKISQNPYVKEVTVKRELPDKIKIEVVEKEKAYMLQVGDEIAYIDRNGDILEISQVKLENLIFLQGYSTSKEQIKAGNTLNEEDIERLSDIQQILKSSEKIEIQNKIASININDKNDYILNIPEYKKIIYIGDTSNLANKMLYAQAILEETTDKEGKIFLNGNFTKGFDPYFREEANN